MTANSSLASSARRALRAAAHHLDPVVMVGQHGITPAVLHEIDLALTAHALIKVRVQSDERETREGYLAEICEKMSCESVQHLGKILVLWRNKQGEAGDDVDVEQDAAAIGAARSNRGPRAKLPSERAARPVPGGRGNALPPGERHRRGEIAPAPRREGWAPKDRRGVARAGGFGGGSDEFPQGRRDGYGAPPSGQGFGAPRGRPAGAGFGDGSAPRGGGTGGAGGRGGYGGGNRGYGGNSGGGYGRAGGGASSGGRGGYGGNSSGGYGGNAGRGGGQGGGGYGRGNDGGNAGGSGSGYGGSSGGAGGAPRPRWGDRRDSSGSTGGTGGGSGYGGGGGRGSGSYGGDRGGAGGGGTGYSGGSDRQAPRGGGAGGSSSWSSRDAVTGKPRGFSGGGRSGGGGGAGGSGAAPRTRRRLG